MQRDLTHEYQLLKEQRSKGLLSEDEWAKGLIGIGEGYLIALEEGGLVPRPLEVEAVV